MRFSPLFALCALSLAPLAPAAEPVAATVPDLQKELAAHVNDARFGGATWGVKIVSLDSGVTIFEDHADRLMSPASNAKLYTCAMAIDVLGADYRILTPVYGTAKPGADGTLNGDLIVSGRGDPSWRSRGTKKEFYSIFDPFVTALKKAGVKHITGDIVGDATWIRGVPTGSSWTVNDLNDDFGAEISALSIDDNYAELHVIPAAVAGQPATLEWMLPDTGLTLDNRTVTVPAGTAKHIESHRLLGETVVHVSGEIPVGATAESLDLPVPRPAAWFAAALKSALVRAGIAVDGGARSLRWPDAPATGPDTGVIKLAEIESPPMRQLIADVMKPSQNLEADLLFAQVGEVRRAPDASPHLTTEEAGVVQLRDFLQRHHLPAEEVLFEEGSGLSRNDLVTANATAALLKFMATHRAGADYAAALPIAGVDGSLRRHMKGTPAENNVHAKTGTLRWANSLSGYVTSAAGEHLAFSLMLNRYVAPKGHSAAGELDAIAVMLARFAGKTAPADAAAQSN